MRRPGSPRSIRPRGSGWTRLAPVALLLAAVVVMIGRRPEYFTAPGFWAEDGVLHFAGAWTRPWWQALLARPAGYFSLWANVAAVLGARLVALREAPLVTTLLALLAQALPLAVIAFGRAPEWRAPGRKLLGMAVVLFASLSGEIWLNTINSQFHLGLAAALVLLEPAAMSGGRVAAYGLGVAVAGLSGVVAASLAPLFVVRAWYARTGAAAALAAVASTCAALQAAAVAAAPVVPSRQLGLGAATAGLVVWMKTLILPVLGVEASHAFVRAVARLVGRDLASASAAVVGSGLLVLAGCVLAVLSWPLPARARLALGGSYVIVTAAAILGGIGDRRMFLGDADNASRYFYVPGALVLFLLMANAWPVDRPAARGRALVCGALLGLGLWLGVLRYRESLRWQPWWPDWRMEVAAWDRDPARPLAIWPPPWTMSLRVRPAPAR